MAPVWSANDMRVRQWILNNPGVCKKVSEQCRVSSEYVRLVLYGKRNSLKVRNALRLKGAPVR